MHPSLLIYESADLSFINTGFSVETLAADCQFTEGPVWHPDGWYLFSDITANVVYKLQPGAPKEILIAESGTDNLTDEDLKPDQTGSNGLAYTNDGSLLVCRHGSHEVARWNGTALETVVGSYNNKPLNSPNDIIVDSRNRVFFSDPPYGLKSGQPAPEKFQPLAGVYCHDNGTLTVVCDKYQYPNGVCITPAGDELYICSNKPFEAFISVYDVETLQYKKELAQETSDGIKCSPEGHVWLCNKDGVIILNSEGKRLGLISFPAIPANICWGGSQKKDLFICAREYVFLIRNLLR